MRGTPRVEALARFPSASPLRLASQHVAISIDARTTLA
jgi:hypothetical protein